MESLQSIKQRFEIIGNDPKLNRALEKCIGVAPTDISVLITGESGVGKETLPKIIHTLSTRNLTQDHSHLIHTKTRKIYCRKLRRYSGRND